MKYIYIVSDNFNVNYQHKIITKREFRKNDQDEFTMVNFKPYYFLTFHQTIIIENSRNPNLYLIFSRNNSAKRRRTEADDSDDEDITMGNTFHAQMVIFHLIYLCQLICTVEPVGIQPGHYNRIRN